MNNEGPSALEQEAMAAYREKRLGAAEQAFAAARQKYSEVGERAKAAEMANNLCVVLLDAGLPQKALEAVYPTVEAFGELKDHLHLAQAYGNLASAQEACGKTTEAEASYRKAAETFAAIGDKDNRAHCLKALSQLELCHGRHLEAAASMQAALDSQQKPGVMSRLLRWLLRLLSRLLGWPAG